MQQLIVELQISEKFCNWHAFQSMVTKLHWIFLVMYHLMMRIIVSIEFSAVGTIQNQDSKLKLFLHLNKPWDDKTWTSSKKINIWSFCGWPNCVEQLKIGNAIYWFNLELISNYHLFNPSYKCGQHKVIEHSFNCISS